MIHNISDSSSDASLSTALSHFQPNQLQSSSIIDPAPPELFPKITNVCATVSLGCSLDLLKIATSTRNTEYSPQRFAPAVVMRLRDPRCTALIFNSGRMVVMGAKSTATAHLGARKFARIIQKVGFDAQFRDFHIENMTATTSINFPVRLEGLAYEHSEFCSYEPELFPGLIYRMITPPVVCLVFVSGKVNFTGARTEEEIRQAFINMWPVLREFRKGNYRTVEAIDSH